VKVDGIASPGASTDRKLAQENKQCLDSIHGRRLEGGQPVPELAALQTALVQFQTRILNDQELLLKGQYRLADVQAEPARLCNSEPSSSHLIVIVTDREQIGNISAI
jgi:hypothetical protein